MFDEELQCFAEQTMVRDKKRRCNFSRLHDSSRNTHVVRSLLYIYYRFGDGTDASRDGSRQLASVKLRGKAAEAIIRDAFRSDFVFS